MLACGGNRFAKFLSFPRKAKLGKASGLAAWRECEGTEYSVRDPVAQHASRLPEVCSGSPLPLATRVAAAAHTKGQLKVGLSRVVPVSLPLIHSMLRAT